MNQDVQISWDDFYYYSKQDVTIENRNDLWIGILQPQRTFLYNRQDSAGVTENLPTGFSAFIILRYAIAAWIAYRNNYVSNGSGDTKDRRIAVSQETIGIEFPDRNNGEIDLTILYMDYVNSLEIQQTNLTLGV